MYLPTQCTFSRLNSRTGNILHKKMSFQALPNVCFVVLVAAGLHWPPISYLCYCCPYLFSYLIPCLGIVLCQKTKVIFDTIITQRMLISDVRGRLRNVDMFNWVRQSVLCGAEYLVCCDRKQSYEQVFCLMQTMLLGYISRPFFHFRDLTYFKRDTQHLKKWLFSD
jgi:hypothetical protein